MSANGDRRASPVRFYTVMPPGACLVGFDTEEKAVAYAKREVEFLGSLAVFEAIRSFTHDGERVIEDTPRGGSSSDDDDGSGKDD